TALCLEDAQREIRDSKAEIERQIGSCVRSFCYPNGTSKDYNERIKQLVRECGYENATVTVRPSGGKVDLYEIGRIGSEASMHRFKRSVSGLTQLAALVNGGRLGRAGKEGAAW